MVSLRRFLFLVFILMTSNCYAATYYFSTSGNNTTGTGTQAAPFNSLCGPYPGAPCATGTNKISMGTIAVNPGDQLLFKRGDEWVGMNAVWTINATGAAGNPITFGAYGDPNLPRPIFRGAMSAYELGKDNWTNVAGTSIWYTTGINWWPNMAAQEESAPQGPQLYGAWSVQGTTNANGWMSNQSMVRGTHFYDSGTQRLYVWRTDNLKPDHAAGRDIFIGGASNDGTNRLVKVWRGYAGTSTAAQFVGGHYIFQDLHVKMAKDYGFSTSYPNTQFINCLSELNGMEGFLFDRRRFGAPLPGSKDSEMRNCVSRRNNLAQGGSIGQGITVESENVWIYDSESYENGFAGIDYLDYDINTKTDGGGIVNCKVHNNGIQPVSMASFDANIYIDGGSNITIKDTQVWGAGIDPRGTKTRLRGNVGIAIDVEGPGFAAGKRPHGIKVINTISYGNAGGAINIGSGNGGQSAVDSFSDIQFIGCTFQRDRGDNDILGYYGSDYTDVGNRVVQFWNISSGFVFKNNIVIASNTVRAPVFGDIGMFNAGKSKMDFDNNIYYCPSCNFNTTGGYSSGGFFSYNYISNMTIDQFRNLGGAANMQQDSALSKTTLMSDPLLVNSSPSAFDAHLQTNSPALNIANTAAFPAGMTAGTTRADGAADSPYNDLGFHYPLTGNPPPPPGPDTQAPTVPAGLAALESGGLVLLTWNAATDNTAVTGYQVFDGAVLLGTSTTLGYTLQNAVNGQTYNFAVRAYDAANNISLPSSTVTLTVGAVSQDTSAPTTPLNLTAPLSGTQVTLSWTASTDNVAVTGYQVLNNGSTIGTSTTTSFAHTVSYSTVYNYAVRAYDAAGNYSTASNLVTVTVPSAPPSGLPAPTNLTAAYVNSQVQLSWTASANAYGYNVYRNGAYWKSVGQTSTFHNGVTAGTTYNYNVQAYDVSAILSPLSTTASITIPGGAPDTTAPSVPSNLTANSTTTEITLNWTASTDNVAVTSYKVFNGAAQIGTAAGTTYLVSPAASAATYGLTVQACDAAANCSAASNLVTVTMPDTTAPAAPAGLAASLNGSAVDLVWTASTDNVGVTGYQILSGATVVGTSAVTSYTFSPASAGQSYSFTVKAYDAAGNLSGASNAAAIVPADTAAPSVPVLSGIVSGTQAMLSWLASTDNVAVTGYQVFENSVLKSTTNTLAYTASGLLSGQNYTYTARAVDAANNLSAPSNAVTLTVPGPSAPTDLIAFLSGSSVSIAWSTSANATGYALYRNDLLLQNLTSASHTDTAVSAGQTYIYKVQAFDDANNLSVFSNSMSVTVPPAPDTTAPSIPSNLSSALSGSSINLTWTASTDNVAVTGYQILNNGSVIGTSVLTNYTVPGTPGTTYSFTVKAFDAAGNYSGASSVRTVTIPSSGPATPANLAAVYTNSQVQLTWNAAANAYGYNVYRNGNYWKSIGQTSTTDTTVTSGNTYTYNVQSYDVSAVLSGLSNTASITIQAPAPDTTAPSIPSSLTASLSGTTANLTWTASTDNVGVTGYQVFENSIPRGTTTSLTYSAPNLLPGQYTYTVKATDAAGNVSASSNSASVTLAPQQLPAPSSLTGYISGSNKKVTLSWMSSAGAAGYNIYRNGALLMMSASNPAVDIPGNGLYTYNVQAYSGTQLSPFSNGLLVRVGESNSVTNVPADTQAPSVPGSPQASYSSVNDQILLTWSASSDNAAVANYNVMDNSSQIGQSASTSYALSSPLPGTTHVMGVRACDTSFNCSAWTTAAAVTIAPLVPDTTAPSVPSSLTASLSSTTANLSWTASTDNIGVTGYQVFQSATLMGTTTSTAYSATGLTAGQTYLFTVKALDAANNISGSSNSVSVTVPVPDTTAPSIPSNLTASLSGTTANLSWSASTDNVGVTGYQVFDGATLKGTTASTAYSAAGLSVGSHSFTVKATDAANNLSGSSNAASVTVVDTTAPSVPANLTASLSGTTANLSWSASTDNVAVTGYQVFQGATLRGTTASTSYSATGLTQGQIYSFTVRAVDAANNISGSSNTASVTVPVPDTTAPSAPVNLTGNLNASSISLNWGASTDNVGVTGYQVFSSGVQVGNATATAFTLSPLAPGQTYYLTVKAQDAAGNLSSASNTVTLVAPTVFVDVTPPTAPSNLTVQKAGMNVTLNWLPSIDDVGIAGYQIFENARLIGTSSTTTFAYRMPPYERHVFMVQAVDAAGNVSPASNTALPQ